jgi:hypothetical protein
MFCTLKTRALALPLKFHAVATLVAFGAFQGTRITLDRLYAASQHPVDFATGQLAFDGALIDGYYASMRVGGTFDTYVRTQIFDFAFIASVIVFGILFGTLLSRLGRAGTAPATMGIGAAYFACAGATLDAAENMVSFVLMQFESIPQVLAYLYSIFAALKFISLTLAMALALGALITGLGGKVWGMFRPQRLA